MSGLDPVLLAILVCPLTRTALRYDETAGELVSEAAGLAYPVRDGIPLMAQPGALPAPALDSLLEQVRGLDMVAVRKQYEEAKAAQESGAPQKFDHGAQI